MSAKIQVRRDITGSAGTGWSANPNLAPGEIGLDTTLNQIKIGLGPSDTAWNSLAWLGGTLPVFSSPSTDLNNATNSVQGVYRFTDGSALTNGPGVNIDIKAADGGACMIVMVFGAIVLQQLFTDGDGSQPQKTYSRIYDGSWRAWTPQNTWGVDATEGTSVNCRMLDVKSVATFADGSSANPSISNNGDNDTGIYWPADNSIALVTGGTARLTIGAAGGVTLTNNLQVDGTLNMTSGQISNLADPTSAADAATKSYVDGTRVGQTAVIAVNGTTVHTQVSGTSTSGLFTIGTAGIGNLRSVVGTWRGIACSPTGGYRQLDVNTSSASTADVGGDPAPTNTFHATLVRIS